MEYLTSSCHLMKPIHSVPFTPTKVVLYFRYHAKLAHSPSKFFSEPLIKPPLNQQKGVGGCCTNTIPLSQTQKGNIRNESW